MPLNLLFIYTDNDGRAFAQWSVPCLSELILFYSWIILSPAGCDYVQRYCVRGSGSFNERSCGQITLWTGLLPQWMSNSFLARVICLLRWQQITCRLTGRVSVILRYTFHPAPPPPQQPAVSYTMHTKLRPCFSATCRYSVITRNWAVCSSIFQSVYN